MSADRDAHDYRCRNDHRLLFRKKPEGIVVFCRTCKQDHLISWADLEKIRAEQTHQTPTVAPQT